MSQHNNTRNIDFESFFVVHPDLLCIADTRGNIIKVNAAWKEIMGYAPSYLDGRSILEFFHPEDVELTRQTLFTASTTTAPVKGFVTRVRHTDNTYRYLEWRSTWHNDMIYAAAQDITERKNTNEQLWQLSKAVEYSPATVFITDSQGNIEYVNDKFSELTGYTKEEVLGRNPNFLKSGEQDNSYYTELWRTISSGNSWRGVFHNRKKNGDLYWESALIAPIVDARGTITHYVAIKEDITAQKAVEEELKRSNNLLDLFFRQSLDGFFFMMLDEPVEWNESTNKDAALDYIFAHQRITKINDAMVDQYRANENDFLGLTPNDFYRHDISYGKAVWREFFDNGKLHIDTTEQKFDGTPMIIEGDYICIYDEQGRITGHFGVQRDVSFEREAKEKLYESEERFRQLADNIDQVFFLRTEKEMLYVSPAYETIFGQSRKSLYANPDSYIEAIHPEDKDEVLRWFSSPMEKFDFEYRIVRPDGEERWIWASAFPVKTSDSGAERIAGIARDISERKKLEAQLREASIRDGLTGLYNRRHVFELLEPFVEKAKRGLGIFSLALIDIDHFKEVNDTYGHIAGDKVLKELARILSESLRAYDLVGRFGGEEFLIAFTDTTREKAQTLAERVLQKVRDNAVTYESVQIFYTFSCGIADSSYCAAKECDLEELIARADKNLYLAKDSGRNQVIS